MTDDTPEPVEPQTQQPPIDRTAARSAQLIAAADASARAAGASTRAGGATTTGEALRSARLVSLVTLVSRVLGLIRDVATAALFGAGWVWDAFVLAFMVPNLFRRLFGEGSLSAAFVPVYAETLEKSGPRKASALLANALTVVVIGMAAITVVVIALGLLLPDAAWSFAFGNQEAPKLALFRWLLPVLMPFVIIICAIALLGGALNVHGRFFQSAFAPVLLNVVWMIGIGIAMTSPFQGDPTSQALIVAASIVVGALLGFAHHIKGVRRQTRVDRFHLERVGNTDDAANLRPLRPRLDLKDDGLRTVFARMAPTMLGLGLLQISVLIDNLIAEAMVSGEGAVSALYYGNRLMQFPLAMIGVAMGVAVFPLLARHAARGETLQFRRALTDCQRITLFLAIPAAVGLIALAGPIVEVLFRRGAFGPDAQARTTMVVVCYSVGVVAACVRMLQTRAFFALGDTRTPVRVSLQVLVLNVIGNVILVQTPLQEAGLALSTAISTTLSALVMAVQLRRRGRADVQAAAAQALPGDPGGDPGETTVREFFISLGRNLLAAAAMAGAVVGLSMLVNQLENGWQSMHAILRVVVLGMIVSFGAGFYIGIAKALGAPEPREILRRGR